MTRIAKLYARFLAGQRLSFADFERLLSAFNYEFKRQNGSHRVWVNKAAADARTIQPRGKDAKPYQLDQFRDIIEKLALTLDESE